MFLSCLSSIELDFYDKNLKLDNNIVEVAYPVIQELIDIKKKGGKTMPTLNPTITPNLTLDSIIKPYIEHLQVINHSKISLDKAEVLNGMDLATIKLINCDIPSNIAYEKDPTLMNAVLLKKHIHTKNEKTLNLKRAEMCLNKLEEFIDDETKLKALKWHKLLE